MPTIFGKRRSSERNLKKLQNRLAGARAKEKGEIHGFSQGQVAAEQKRQIKGIVSAQNKNLAPTRSAVHREIVGQPSVLINKGKRRSRNA